MSAHVIGVLPARLDSKRFPRKVVYPYRGKPLLYYIWDSVRRSKEIDRLLIASDSAEVISAAKSFGAETIRTSSRHRTGSDRVAEVLGKVNGDIFVNIQADNFGLKGSALDRVLRSMKADRRLTVATLARRIESDHDLNNPGVVKVVLNTDGTAAWFSRYAIPYLQRPSRGSRFKQFPFLEHIGVYFYRRSALEEFASQRRTPLEKVESLEQLRVLENGGSMKVFVTRARSVSVDCPEDLKKLDRLYR